MTMFRSRMLRNAGGRRKQPWYVGSNGVSGGGQTITLTGLTGGYWSELAQNDIVVVASVCSNSAQNPTISTAGYTQIVNETQGALRLIVGYKVMGVTPDTSVTVANTDNETARAWAFRGVNASTPIDATTTVAKANSTVMDNPAITTATDAAIVLAIGSARRIPNSLPGMVPIASSSTSFPLVEVIVVGASYIAHGQAGVYDPAARAAAPSAFDWITATVALRPA